MPRAKNSDATLAKLQSVAAVIEDESAVDADKVGLMARVMVQATLPHTRVRDHVFTRVNGDITLHLTTSPDKEIPYGSIPRLVIAWVTREAKRTGKRKLDLGRSLASFMEDEIGVPARSGSKGNVKPFRQQVSSLFSCNIELIDRREGTKEKRLPFSYEANYWWDTKHPDQEALFPSWVELSESFFKEITANPVPIDLRVMAALKKSPLALDIYTWLTHRSSYLKNPTTVKWDALSIQLGCTYGRVRDFRAAFLHELRKVHVLYRGVEFEVEDDGLLLKPSRTHIARTARATLPSPAKREGSATLPSPHK